MNFSSSSVTQCTHTLGLSKEAEYSYPRCQSYPKAYAMNCPFEDVLQAEIGCLLNEKDLILFLSSKSQKYIFPSDPQVSKKLSERALKLRALTGYKI